MLAAVSASSVGPCASKRPCCCERLTRDLEIRYALQLERAQVWVAPHQHDVEHAEVERRLGFLRHDRDLAGELSVGQPPNFGAVQGDVSRRGPQNSRENA